MKAKGESEAQRKVVRLNKAMLTAIDETGGEAHIFLQDLELQLAAPDPSRAARIVETAWDNRTRPAFWRAMASIAEKLKDGKICPLFHSASMKNAQAFASRLKTATDPVSSYLRTRLRQSTLTQLITWQGFGVIPRTLQDLLIEELNAVVVGPSIWESSRFAACKLRSETHEFIARNPIGDARIRLNRLLLEDAFPTELRRINDDRRGKTYDTYADRTCAWIFLHKAEIVERELSAAKVWKRIAAEFGLSVDSSAGEKQVSRIMSAAGMIADKRKKKSAPHLSRTKRRPSVGDSKAEPGDKARHEVTS